MGEYFIRHGRKSRKPHEEPSISINDKTINDLWEKNKIAIHFPGSGKEDLESINPKDYKRNKEKYAITVFRELNNNGGHIMAEYRTKPNIVKIGIINPKSFNIYRTEWFTKDPKNKGRIAKLKTLSFKKSCCVSLDEDDVRSLYNNIPRRKTINRWPSAKGRLKTLIDNYCK